MATDDRIQQLEQKHKILENELGQLMTHLSSTDDEIVDVKRQKLHLKDQISQLRNEFAQP